VLLHLVRGTGLKGLGGIAPVNGKYIRPMLDITRAQVLAFLEDYHLMYMEDSSNAGDEFLRNRLRHHVMPLLRKENPRFAENTSRMAQRLREDEATLAALSACDDLPTVPELQKMPDALRSRVLERFLKESGVKEPETDHISLAESLLFSDNPSARAQYPGGVTIRRCYARLEAAHQEEAATYRTLCGPAEVIENTDRVFTVRPIGPVVVRSRQTGDEMRLPGGTKSLKKLFIDRKIPAHLRSRTPVVADDAGVIGVYGIGVNLDRAAQTLPATRIEIEER
jgi:tRNA(Ile)-lysidine synthase